LKISPVLLYWKMATFDGFNKSFFCNSSAKYAANFVILFLLLLEMIRALNVLKHLQPQFNCNNTVNDWWKKLIGLWANHSWSQKWKITKTGAWLTKLSQKQFSVSIYGMSVILNVSNLTRSGDNIVNMWCKCFSCLGTDCFW